MLKTRIIPCLDVKDGRVVKGINFVDLVDAGNPVEVAKTYDKSGADELCFLDITASHEKRPILLDTVKKTAEQCFMPLTVGGGVRSISDIQSLLSSGADKVSINTAAVSNPDLIYEASSIFGSQNNFRCPVQRQLKRANRNSSSSIFGKFNRVYVYIEHKFEFHVVQSISMIGFGWFF